VSGHKDWNTNVIEEFRANEGRVGGPFEGAPLLLLHHIGARSGTERVSPLVYLPQGDQLIIIASKGGAPTNPDWYHNLRAHPVVDVEVGTARFAVKATESVGEERAGLWDRIVGQMPGFADYQRNAARQIPVLILSRVD